MQGGAVSAFGDEGNFSRGILARPQVSSRESGGSRIRIRNRQQRAASHRNRSCHDPQQTWHAFSARRARDLMKMAFDRVEICESPRCLEVGAPALCDRLRGVTWSGNLLVCCLFSVSVPGHLRSLERPAIAFWHRRIRVEPQDDFSTLRVASSGHSGRVTGDAVARWTNTDLVGDTRPVPKPRACKGSCGTRRHEKHGCSGTACGRARVVSGHAGDGAERESVSRGGPCGPAKHLRDAPAGLSVASGRKSGKAIAGGKRDRGP